MKPIEMRFFYGSFRQRCRHALTPKFLMDVSSHLYRATRRQQNQVTRQCAIDESHEIDASAQLLKPILPEDAIRRRESKRVTQARITGVHFFERRAVFWRQRPHCDLVCD